MKSEIIRRVPAACADEATAVAFLEEMRWGTEPQCPRCFAKHVAKMTDGKGARNARYLWRCYGCKKQFTVRVKSVMEDSKIPARHWAFAFWQACAGKKGVSALQIQRQTGLSYEAAHFMMHRIRCAMAESHKSTPKLSGVIEADETWVGGRARPGQNPRKYAERKTAVMVMVERDGRAIAKHIDRVNSMTLQKNLLQHVNLDRSELMTDENASYPAIGQRFALGHQTVNHSKKEYARGRVTTNSAESFFSLLKRGLHGSYHSVSKRHLHRYVSEFEYRWNTRKLDDGERLRIAIRNSSHKRLFYRAPVARTA